MNKENYIQLRINNRYIEILYDYAYNRGFKYSLQQFYNYFIAYSQTISQNTINSYLDNVLLHYDMKYDIMIISKTEQLKFHDELGNTIEKTNLKIIKIM